MEQYRRQELEVLADLLEERLEGFTQAVNVFWTWALRHGLPSALASDWRRKNRKRAHGIDREDIEAEVIFALRAFIVRFDPNGEERLFSYAYRGIHQHLTEWSAQAMPVQVPQKAARSVLAAQDRVGYDPSRGPAGSYNPWDEIDSYLDGDHEEV